MPTAHYYQKSAKDVAGELGVSLESGLSHLQVRERFTTFGPNILAAKRQETTLDIFIRQFKSPLIYVLIFAALLVIALGQVIDALVIIAVVTLNSIIGTVQEGKARNSLERLKHLTRHRALVRRAGQEILISSEEVVPGDILILHQGDRIVADARIIRDESLRIDESVLTGEAYTVAKVSTALKARNLVVGDQKNMVFAGTSIASGTCEAVVVATGVASELGKISRELVETSTIPLPLADKINRLTHFIAIFVILICASVFLIGIFRGIGFLEIFTAVVGLAVSIVPEGLPVAVTIILARGVWRMAKTSAIVRQMAAVEAMGSADTLLVDKTGTITSGQMKVAELYFGGKIFSVSGSGYEPVGKVRGAGAKLKTFLSLVYAALDADVVKHEADGWKPVGDPTEAAIAVACRKAGVAREKILEQYKVLSSKPFNSDKRYIEAIFGKGAKKWRVYVGAPDFLNRDLRIDHGLLSQWKELTKKGRRVVGAAIFGPDKMRQSCLFAIDEDIRDEVEKAVGQAKRAGFGVVMLTGDFANTARSIAKRVGIFTPGTRVMTGDEVEQMSDAQLSTQIENVSVFARITPTHKFKIVNAFKRLGHIVAMTGDGVNDGPALQAANLGIGLGSGTQVAKDAADIVLVDDNFTTIVRAIAEGRAIYKTLKRVILYLFSTSLGEVLTIASAIFLGLPLPLVAVQIIWLNFVTDGFFVVALAQDNPVGQKLSKSEAEEPLVDAPAVKRMILMGASMLAIALPAFYFYLDAGLEYARSMALVILSATQWFNALNVRSETRSIFRTPLNNPYIIASFVAVFMLTFLVVQTTFGNEIMHTVPLSLKDWAVVFALSTVIIWVEEIRKFFVRRV